MRLIDAPIGIFRFDGELVLKTEYYSKDKQSGKYIPDCYIIRTGEYFWGSAKTANELINLDIEPVDFAELLPTVTDTISRKQAVDALRKMQTYKLFSGDDMLLIDQAGAQTELMLLPFAQPEIIYCKDCKKQNKHYHESPYKDTVCPLTAWRGKAQGHEYDYQYCCYADRREVTT